jgi:hypothetical protein
LSPNLKIRMTSFLPTLTRKSLSVGLLPALAWVRVVSPNTAGCSHRRPNAGVTAKSLLLWPGPCFRPPRAERLSRKIRPSLPPWASTLGNVAVPNGRPTGPPAPKSVSAASRVGALPGLKKSLAARVPLALTPSRITDSASCPPGELPARTLGDTPLPEVKKIRPGPSDISPPPLCQMPPWL